MNPIHFAAPHAASREGRIRPRQPSMLDVCAALFLTLAGLLGREGSPHGE